MKINIVGASGSGVTTLGEQLSRELNIPYFDSDYYYWEPSNPPFTIRRDPAKRNAMLQQDIVPYKDALLGGSFISWGDEWLTTFDLVVFLWIPSTIRIERLKQRELERYGEIIYTNEERNRLFNEFIDWASGYDSGIARGRTLQAHEEWLKKLNCPVVEIRGNKSIESRVKIVMQAIHSHFRFLQ
jgi:adenylate kinase family enzyme